MDRVIRGVAAGMMALALLVAAGCGGSDNDASVTKAEFVERGNAICAKGEKAKNEALVAAFKKLEAQKFTGNLSQPAQEKLMTSVALPPIRTMSEELAALEAPSEEAEEAEAIVTGFEKAVSKVQKDPASVLDSATDPFTEANELSGEFGMKECTKI